MIVEKRKVWRWFAGGKGYASGYHAYKAMAKKALYQELNLSMLGHDDISHERWLKLVYQAYATKFPHAPDGSCQHRRYGYRNCRPDSAYCKVAYDNWINAKMEEMRQQDAREASA